MTYQYEEEIKVDVAAEEVTALTDHDKHLVDPMGSGFTWYTPPLAATKEHSTGGQTWQISGHDMQVLTMSLPPHDVVVTEVGSFMFGSPDIKIDVELTLCSRKGFGAGCQRICGGESCVKLMLENDTTSDGYVGMTPNFPAKIVPIKVGLLVRFKHFDKYRERDKI
jgi:Mitochondrial biogenesis AIM24